MWVRALWNLKTVLLLALLLRVLAAVLVEQHVQNAGRRFLIEGDANGYWELAGRLAHGQTYAIHHPPRYVLRTPGFPLLLAGSIRLFGDHVMAARLVLAVVGTTCCALTFLLGRHWRGRTVGLTAAALMAVSPLHVGNSVLILSETTFACGLLVCLLLLSCLLRPHVPHASAGGVLAWAFGIGIATGVTVLIRPGWLLWAGFSSLLVVAFLKQSLRVRGLAAVLIVTGCLTALSPWAFRNYTVTGHWILTSLWSGASLYDGLHPGATGASDMTFVDQQTVLADMSEFDANAHYKRLAFQFVVDHKWRTLELAVIKAGRYLSLVPNAAGFANGPLYLVCLVFYGGFFTAVVIGVWKLRREACFLAVVLTPFLQFLLVHMVFVGSIRYRLPVEYALAILAVAAILPASRQNDVSATRAA